MRIAVLGDTHGDFSTLSHLRAGTELCLIAGDFGGVFLCNNQERIAIEALGLLPFQIAFVEGNHDNIDALSSLELTPWNGGLAHQVSSNVFHLPRGELFQLGEKTCFTFGGGFSTDRDLRKRTVVKTYWEREMPLCSEYDRGIEQLESVGYKVDIILTHTAPASITKMLCNDGLKDPAEAPLNYYLERIMQRSSYEMWFCGHFHCETSFERERIHCLYKNTMYLDF